MHLSPYTLKMFLYLIAFATLLVMSISDIKKRLLPIALFLPIIVYCLIFGMGVFSHIWLDCLVTAILLGNMFLLFALFQKCGGGDVIMVSVMALCFGAKPLLFSIFFASAGMLLWHFGETIYKKVQKQHIEKISTVWYPYAPFMFFGFAVFSVYNYLSGGF